MKGYVAFSILLLKDHSQSASLSFNLPTLLHNQTKCMPSFPCSLSLQSIPSPAPPSLLIHQTFPTATTFLVRATSPSTFFALTPHLNDNNNNSPLSLIVSYAPSSMHVNLVANPTQPRCATFAAPRSLLTAQVTRSKHSTLSSEQRVRRSV